MHVKRTLRNHRMGVFTRIGRVLVRLGRAVCLYMYWASSLAGRFFIFINTIPSHYNTSSSSLYTLTHIVYNSDFCSKSPGHHSVARSSFVNISQL
ncbi:hypothetical protein CC86DRAFT_188268 [Ophiobolus disseminans]|uniref:Uncharacterized protein n=1 Tax=Ophiobolus disseminans TaxID=1469910 RepID=A0A6A7A7Q9_9PLEO|nr:hypothetical protein CC86DRAFT_188268 [Ophiobolus disseminans]